MYLVTGHYDSLNSNVFELGDTSGAAPGANDDASGVAVSLECARALSKLHFPATLVFVAVAGEEQGLVGSAHLAKLARDEGWQLEAVLNNDIVGGNTTPGDTLQLKDRVRVFSEGIPVAATPQEIRRIRALGKENDSPSRELARAIADTGRTLLPGRRARRPSSAFLVSRPDRYLRGGDHSSFNQQGFAAVRFTEWREDYNHQHQDVVIPPAGSGEPILGDLPRFVDYNYVAQSGAAERGHAGHAGLRAGRAAARWPSNNEKLENNTTLTWEPPAGAQPSRTMRCLWRETTAPDWQFVKHGGAAGAGCAGDGDPAHLQRQRDLRRARRGRGRTSRAGGGSVTGEPRRRDGDSHDTRTSTIYPVDYDAQDWLHSVRLPGLPRRHPPPGAVEPWRLFCADGGSDGVSGRGGAMCRAAGLCARRLSAWLRCGSRSPTASSIPR